jgi:F-type H+-transporting ATPase subunit delta
MKASGQARRDAKQLFRACLVKGLLNESRGRQAVQQLVKSKPRGYLGVLSHFLRLLKLDQARHTARVESAKPLPADLQTGVKTALANIYGQALSASFAENPALLGGMRIRVGSDVYDGSIQARLAALEQSFESC